MNDRMQHLSRLALMLALATVIHTAEAVLPVTFVWFRFGFANIVGLSTLYLFGFKDAVVVTIGRIILGSLFAGLFGSPAFLLSLAGGTVSLPAMGLVHRWGSRVFSEVGISVVGAVAHNAAQLVVAYLLLVRNTGIFLLLPLMLFAAVGTGFVNGLATRFLVAHFRKVRL
ncbi:MAG: Gx transporter family protein [Pseudomonadota bacterium]